MKKATVLYLAGTGNIDEEFDEENAICELGLDPGSTLLSASAPNFYDLHDALRLLIQGGHKRIEALGVIQGLDGKLKTLGEPMHLYGV